GAHSDFVASASGTQGIAGAADSILTIERGRGDTEATLNVTSRDAAEGSYAIHLDGGRWLLDGNDLAEASNAVQTRKSIDGLGTKMTELVKLVGENPEGIRAKDVAISLGLSDQDARIYLKRGYDKSRIRKIERGLYGPVTSETTVTMPTKTGQ